MPQRPRSGARSRALTTLLIPTLLISALLAPTASAAKGRELGAATPEALVARLEAAYESGDLVETAACLAPDDRAEITVGILLGSSMMVAFMGMGGEMASGMAEGMAEGPKDQPLSQKEKAKLEKSKKEMEKKAKAFEQRYEAILKKHGLAERMSQGPGAATGEKGAAALLAGVDELALLEDLMAFMKELGEGEKISKSGPLADSGGKITDLKVKGDRGTAKAGAEIFQLEKIDGRWYFRAPQKKSQNESPIGGFRAGF